MMGGEMIRGYQKGCFAEQQSSLVLVVVAECTQAQAKNSMAMMQAQDSSWTVIEGLQKQVHW